MQFLFSRVEFLAQRSALIIALLYLGACSTGDSQSEERPNVLLISIDSLRADHLGSYGYGRNTSPVMDALAAEGVLFENVMSSTSWTLPSHASLFTGLPLAAHGCDSKRVKLRRGARTLAEDLRASGYRTAGFWSGPYLHPVFGLGQGFDEYVNCASFDYFEAKEKGAQRRANQQSHEDVTNPKLTQEVLAWLDARQASKETKPFFLFVHMWDVHYDFFPPAPYDSMFAGDYDGEMDGTSMRKLTGAEFGPEDMEYMRALYDGEIAWTDMHVGLILDELEAAGLKQNTLVLLTADHGEEFWERGNFGHRKTLFEESVRIPLIVRYPERVEAGQVLQTLTSIADVAPTILELTGAGSALDDSWMGGNSLVPSMFGKGQPRNRWIFSELHKPQAGTSRVVLRSENWKLLYNPDNDALLGIWDLEKDPQELDNQLVGSTGSVDARKAQARRVYDSLRALSRQDPLQGTEAQAPEEVPDFVNRALAELGYIGGTEDEEQEEDSDEDH